MIEEIINIISLIGGFYFGIWKLLVESISIACAALEAGTLTNSMVIWTVIKCLASPVVSIFTYVMLLVVFLTIYYIVKEILK